MKKQINDWVLIIGVVALAVVAGFSVKVSQAKSTKDAVAIVMVDGKAKGRYPLNENIEKKIEITDGSYNILKIENGEADITEASCPDHICVDHRKVSKKDETIVCLPNKVVIKIENGAESEVDSLTN